MFVGRFQPFHDGHYWLIQEGAFKQGYSAFVAVRDTEVDEGNPYTLEQRIAMIEAAFPGQDLKVEPIPDICGIVYGRKVGYFVTEMEVPEEIGGVSATGIREAIDTGKLLAALESVPAGTAKVLQEIHGG
jgi:cytidyltransferase-like protein